METQDSILSQANIRTLLNKSTFLKLPPEYQYKLSLLLPAVDRHGGKLNHSSFNNEFFAKACQEWKERLFRGDFTPENLTKTKADIESDKRKTDPWKVQNFEPVWGIKKGFDLDPKEEIKDEDEVDQASSSTRSSRMRKIIDDNEDEPLLKKVRSENRVSVQATFEREKVKIEDKELPKIDDYDLEEEETTEETVIEEPVNLLDEQDSISEPPLRSCSIDFEEQEVVSIPSPAIATPPMTTSTPIILPTEPLPATPPITVMACNSPASVRSVRGNSITFSSSRSPSPAASMASLSSAQEDQDEPPPQPPMPIVQDQPPAIDPSLLQTKTVIKPAKTNRTNPTAIINKIRPPIGDVNLERSMEIVRSAVEKSVVNQQQINLRTSPMIIRPVHQQPSQRPTLQAAQASVVPMTSAPQAVLVTTTDGKTLLAHPASQILRPVGPQASPVRVQRLPVTGAKVTPIVGAPITAQHQIQTQRPQVQQVCLVQQQPKQPVFRMPTTTSTMVLDSSQINSLIVSCTT